VTDRSKSRDSLRNFLFAMASLRSLSRMPCNMYGIIGVMRGRAKEEKQKNDKHTDHTRKGEGATDQKYERMTRRRELSLTWLAELHNCSTRGRGIFARYKNIFIRNERPRAPFPRSSRSRIPS
jgi:hypothetical protein